MGVTRVRGAVIWAVVGAVAAGCVAGCATGPDGSGGGSGGGRSVPRATAGSPEMRADEQTAVDSTDAFWRRHFAELFDRSYRSPRVEGGYRGRTGPRCAGAPSVPFNAFYCPAGDFLAWDEDLLAAGYRSIGDAWVYLIIAHEWGHAIQARLARSQVSVAAELQADCLAGASLAGAARDGLISFEPGDRAELARTLAAVADDFPWTSERDHGNARQRTAAFNRGAANGVPACIG